MQDSDGFGYVAADSGRARTFAGGCDIFIDDLRDKGAERQRAAKREEELLRQIQMLEARLAKESYTLKAPERW